MWIKDRSGSFSTEFDLARIWHRIEGSGAFSVLKNAFA